MKELHEKSRGLTLDVTRTSDIEAEVQCKGGSGYRQVVNLRERTCTCREWQVCGKPCLHAIAFIGHIRGSIEAYVHDCYSVQKFRAAYQHIIPALVDKSQCPKSEHGFFLEPPILKNVAGRRRKNRYKESSQKSKGAHKRPICKGYGHHWHSCRQGDPEQITAMLLERGPPKKRSKKSEKENTETAIVVACASTSAPTMIYPSSNDVSNDIVGQINETGLITTSSVRSITASNEPKHASGEQKGKGKGKKKGKGNPKAAKGKTTSQVVAVGELTPKRRGRSTHDVSPDSPAMGTRSRTTASSPAMGTRSKKAPNRLNL